jgi:hypothetical protein
MLIDCIVGQGEVQIKFEQVWLIDRSAEKFAKIQILTSKYSNSQILTSKYLNSQILTSKYLNSQIITSKKIWNKNSIVVSLITSSIISNTQKYFYIHSTKR